MNSKNPNISNAEWRVMQEVWSAEPVTSTQIISQLSESTDWTPGTTKKLLHRLVQKGVLDFQRKGNRYLYRSNFTELQCIENASDRLLHTIFKGRPLPMLAYLVESTRLSGAEVEALRTVLDRVKEELPELSLQISGDTNEQNENLQRAG